MKITKPGKDLSISSRRIKNYRVNYIFKINYAFNASLEKEYLCYIFLIPLLEIEYPIINLWNPNQDLTFLTFQNYCHDFD